MKQLFSSATLKLTSWYLLIVMAISLTFSAIIYQISVAEISRSVSPNASTLRQIILDPQRFEMFRVQRIEEGRAHVLLNLFILNVAALTLGGVASYFLARRTLEPIQDAMDEQGRFVSDASHELRTPLTAMRSEIEIALRNGKLSAKEAREFLQSNLEEVDKLQALSDRLLQLTSENVISLSSVPLDEITSDAITRTISAAQAKSIKIENTVPRINVQANRDSLADLLVILLDNAVKYSDEKTTIIVSTAQQKNQAIVRVTDQGRGIAADDIPHIFDRFYRADTSRSNANISGHGLGLSIAQRIAQQHRTRLEVTSQIGTGTTFSFVLQATPQVKGYKMV